MTPIPRFIGRLLSLAFFALALSAVPAWCQAAGVADELPGSADMAAYADVSGLVHSISPEVVSQLVASHLGRFLGDGMPDPANEIRQASVAVLAGNGTDTQAVAILDNRSNAQTLVSEIRTRLPGQPEAQPASLRGISLLELALPQKKEASFGDLPDGHRLVGEHPVESRDLLADAVAAAADGSKSYTALHRGSLDTGALLSFHLAHPAALASNPRLQRVPWDSLALATLTVRKSGEDSFRLTIQAELTSWLKLQIVKPFVSMALSRAASNPRVPAAAQPLLKRMVPSYSGKTMKLEVEASRQEIEGLLLSLPTFKQPA